MKNVIVTGANGYIGRHVVKALLDKGYAYETEDGSRDFSEVAKIVVLTANPAIS